jgi:hypothetical protein
MRALKEIDIAFVPMTCTMDVDQASSAVAEFKPGVVYRYHYKGHDRKPSPPRWPTARPR